MLATGSPGYSTAPFIPYGAVPLGASPMAGGGGVSPQGFDFGGFAQQIAGQAAQYLPGIIMSLFAAHPVVGPAVRQQQGVAPQGFQLQTPLGGFGWSSAAPQLGGGGVSPQGFDFGAFAQQIAGQAAQALPGIIMSLFAAHPVVGPALRQQGVAPQGFQLQTPFGGFGWSSAAPQLGGGGVSPQGFDFGAFAQQIAGQAAQALPGIIMSLFAANPVVGPAMKQQQQGGPTIH
jgi:hypothetical protein